MVASIQLHSSQEKHTNEGGVEYKTRGSSQESQSLMTERKICFMFVFTAHLSDVKSGVETELDARCGSNFAQLEKLGLNCP